MKHLKITYGDLVLVDGDVEELTFQETDGQVAVSARWKKRAQGGGWLDLLSGAAKKQEPQVKAVPDGCGVESVD